MQQEYLYAEHPDDLFEEDLEEYNSWLDQQEIKEIVILDDDYEGYGC